MRSAVNDFISLVTSWVIRAITRTYQYLISPMLHLWAGPGMGCRFEPTCSEYCKCAVLEHGVIRGVTLSAKRLLRCQPWGGRGGFDPVPTKQGS